MKSVNNKVQIYNTLRETHFAMRHTQPSHQQERVLLLPYSLSQELKQRQLVCTGAGVIVQGLEQNCMKTSGRCMLCDMKNKTDADRLQKFVRRRS
jgi:hypothetical protein